MPGLSAPQLQPARREWVRRATFLGPVAGATMLGTGLAAHLTAGVADPLRWPLLALLAVNLLYAALTGWPAVLGFMVRRMGGALQVSAQPSGLSRTALVGPSGAGKSSVVRVLLGFTAPDAGEVLVDGVPLPALDADAWRARVAHVPERPYLLPGTVADNVRLGRPDATLAEVETALQRAHALEFVRRLPQGLDTPLGEDAARLSGGERLRLALARAFVKDAAVVVLDEPTSQLDDGTEALVLDALRDLAQGRTVVTVTHRSAPLALHDRVVAIDAGRLTSGAMAP